MSLRSSPDKETFLTPEQIKDKNFPNLESPRGRLLVASGRSGHYLAKQVVQQYQDFLIEAGSNGQVLYLENIDHQFSDSETCVELEVDVNGADVYLFQALYDPTSERTVDQNYMAFLIAARTLREWGANHITGITPYLAYARQDKPTKFKREPTTAKLMADFSIEAGLERMVVWHPHQRQIHGFYGGKPLDVLDPLPSFIDQFRRFQNREDVIAVAPDAGASKLITYFSRALNLKSAIASKYRPRPEEAEISEIIGDFSGKQIAIILDDMISSGGTIEAIVQKLVEDKGIKEVYLGISHNLGMERAQQRLRNLHADYHLQGIMVTNSIPQTEQFQSLPFVSIHSLSYTLTQVINRIHYNRSISDLFYIKDAAR